MPEVADFAIPGALNSPSGVCPVHGTMIFRNGMPHCLACAAADAKGVAGNVVGERAVKPEPGEINRPRPDLKEEEAFIAPAAIKAAFVAPPSGDPLAIALAAMKRVPTPRDIKAFKKIQKITVLLEELTGTTTSQEI